MIDIDEAKTRLAGMDVSPSNEEALDLSEQIAVAEATQNFLGQVKELLKARLDDADTAAGTVARSWMISQGLRTDGDVLRCHRDEVLSVTLRPEDFEWTVSIHNNTAVTTNFDVEGWVAYTGMKCPGYFPAHLVAPATAVADYLFELIRRVR